MAALFDFMEPPRRPWEVEPAKPAVPASVPLRDPTVHPDEAPRLNEQCRAILVRLQAGRATNHDLAGIALNYRARVSDLRGIGYRIDVIERDRKTGVSVYALRAESTR